MGQDAMSVVDGSLKVYGIEHLRIADGSIMPRITTGNTMAPPASSSANAQPRSSKPSTHSDIAQKVKWRYLMSGRDIGFDAGGVGLCPSVGDPFGGLVRPLGAFERMFHLIEQKSTKHCLRGGRTG